MIKRQLKLFLLIGGATVLIDFLVYRVAIWLDWLTIDISKTIGFISGSIFAFIANKLWTFEYERRQLQSAVRFALLYLITLLINVWVNSTMLMLLPSSTITVEASFLVATAVSAALNFVGMKWFVFIKLTKSEGV